LRYTDSLQSWHDFYVTAGAAAATLVGLLFVGLSLHIRVVVSHPDVRSLARATLTDFFVVLLIALVVLTPTSDPRTTATWLIVVVLLLVVAVRNTWDLLVTVADRPAAVQPQNRVEHTTVSAGPSRRHR